MGNMLFQFTSCFYFTFINMRFLEYSDPGRGERSTHQKYRFSIKLYLTYKVPKVGYRTT